MLEDLQRHTVNAGLYQSWNAPHGKVTQDTSKSLIPPNPRFFSKQPADPQDLSLLLQSLGGSTIGKVKISPILLEKVKSVLHVVTSL